MKPQERQTEKQTTDQIRTTKLKDAVISALSKYVKSYAFVGGYLAEQTDSKMQEIIEEVKRVFDEVK